MTISLDLSEVHALARDLNTAADRMPERAEGVVSRGAELTTTNMRAIAAFDDGELKASIGADVDGLSFVAGPTVEHGYYNEFGTSVMAAQPFAGPGFDTTLPLILDDLADEASQIL